MSAESTVQPLRRVPVDDIELQVRVDGSDGPWVVMVHALGANHTWDAAAPHPAPRYRVARLDLCGHGGGSAPIGAIRCCVLPMMSPPRWMPSRSRRRTTSVPRHDRP